MPNSYNGWPADPNPANIDVVQSLWFPGGVKAGDVTTVLRYVAEQFHARVEPIVGGWCWGYTYKANVNNPSSLSCHASGTALDINAPEHPNSAGGTFTNAQVGAIYAILDEVSGAVNWLEGYDEMHFEIQVDASALADIAAGLPAGGPPPSQTDWFTMATEADLQRIVDAAIAPVKAVTDDIGSRIHFANTVADVLSGAISMPKAAEIWKGAEYQDALAQFADRKIPGAADRP